MILRLVAVVLIAASVANFVIACRLHPLWPLNLLATIAAYLVAVFAWSKANRGRRG